MKTLVTLLAVFACLSSIACSALPVQEYLVGPDDILEVIVSNHEDLNRSVTVQADGTITFPEAGTFKVSGETPAQVAMFIKSQLEKTRNKVDVLVSPKEIHSLRVRVLGAVKSPGQFDLKNDWRLMDVIDSAGGLTVKPLRISGRIIRNRTEVITIDIQKADERRASEYNIKLQRDDLVLLDEMDISRSQVNVMGAVAKPGLYDLDEQTTPLSLITLAGGPTDKAALSGSYVTRDAKQMHLNLVDTFQGRYDRQISAFRFKPGDLIFIPENLIHISVMGQVAKPGTIPFPEAGMITVIDAINLAGGSSGGNTAKAGIIRVVNSKPTVIPVNIDEILKKGDLKKNIALQPNDVLYIPPAKARSFSWPDILAPITALSILGLHL